MHDFAVTEFERQVLEDLAAIKTNMRWLLGNRKPGCIQELTARRAPRTPRPALHRHRRNARRAADVASRRPRLLPPAPLTAMTKREFIAAATSAALASSRASGFPPGITVAQAALESNWGQSRLSRDANNYFGIKAHGEHARVAYPTFEHVNGRDVRVNAEFASYASMDECFADRDRLIASAACYAEARACRADPEAFARALAVHWATDPHYADKLLCVYRDRRLDVLDSALHVNTTT